MYIIRLWLRKDKYKYIIVLIMSNLTIGKIVNNSATLILNSTDQDGFGEKIITGNNFRKLGSYNPASTYQVKTDDFYAKQPYSETFFQYINGPIADQTVVTQYDDFVVGKYYAIKTKGIGDLNKAGNVGTTASFVRGHSVIGNPILDMTDGQLATEPTAGLYYKCLNQPPSGVTITWGTAVQVEEIKSGTIFKVADTATLEPDFKGTAYALSALDYNNVDYRISIPNETSFPGKSRCLVKVEAVSATGITALDYPLYVDIPEMAPHNLFVKERRALGMVFGGIWNPSSIIDCGVMGQSPFGQTLTVKLKDGSNHQTIGDSNVHTDLASQTALTSIKMYPTTIVLRKLFLTNDDLKEI
jgi:hypothetical protein